MCHASSRETQVPRSTGPVWLLSSRVGKDRGWRERRRVGEGALTWQVQGAGVPNDVRESGREAQGAQGRRLPDRHLKVSGGGRARRQETSSRCQQVAGERARPPDTSPFCPNLVFPIRNLTASSGPWLFTQEKKKNALSLRWSSRCDLL